MFCNKSILCLILLISNCHSIEDNEPMVISKNAIITSNLNTEQYINNMYCNFIFNSMDNSNCHFSIYNGIETNAINGCNIIVGNKNNDTNFALQNYAKLYIPNNTKLNICNNSALRIQKDGILINEGEICVKKAASLITIPIDVSVHSNDFIINNGVRTLKHGIDNTNGIIAFTNKSKAYWKENHEEFPITIYNGTVDFSHCLTRNKDLNIKLEGVTVKLFNCDANEADNYIDNISEFSNVHIGNNCRLLDINNTQHNINIIQNSFADDSNDFIWG